MDEFAGNSRKSKIPPEPEQEKKIDKVVTGKVIKKKRGGFQKASDTLLAEDIGSVKSYVISEVIIPSLKKIACDIIVDGAQMLLYGETRRDTRGTSTNSRYSYHREYNRESARREPTRRSVYSYDDVVVETRGEAEQVLMTLDEILETYHVVTVGDLNDALGITGQYTDRKYGWTDLSTASTIRVRDGYLLKMPRALPL